MGPGPRLGWLVRGTAEVIYPRRGTNGVLAAVFVVFVLCLGFVGASDAAACQSSWLPQAEQEAIAPEVETGDWAPQN